MYVYISVHRGMAVFYSCSHSTHHNRFITSCRHDKRLRHASMRHLLSTFERHQFSSVKVIIYIYFLEFPNLIFNASVENLQVSK